MKGVYLLIMAAVHASRGAKRIPDFVSICKRDDPKISECYMNSFNAVLQRLENGLPEMNLRKADPLLVETLTVDQGSSSALGFKAVLSNLQLFGLSKLKVTKADINMDTLVFKVHLDVSKLYLTSVFNAKGKVLLFQFDSDGSFTGNLTDVHISGAWKGNKIEKKGKTHVRFDVPDLDVEIKDIKLNFDNLLPNKELNDHTNHAINENVDVLYEEMKPVIVETVKSIIIDSVNNVYKLFPLDALFPK